MAVALLFVQMLVRTLHTCSVKFPDVAVSIVPLVRENFLCHGNNLTGSKTLMPRVHCVVGYYKASSALSYNRRLALMVLQQTRYM